MSENVFAQADITVIGAMEKQVAVLVPETGNRIAVDLGDLEAFAACCGAKTVDGHVKAIVGGAGSWSASEARAAVENLLAKGLLCRLKPAAMHSEESGVPTVGIVTADRPEMLSRCLSSVVDQAVAYESSPRVVVVDGSRHAEASRRNEAIVRSVDGSVVRVSYVGKKEVSNVLDVVQAEGGVRDVLAGVFRPRAYGACRNVLLLVTAGHKLLMLDDDVVCNGWSGSETRPRARPVAVGHDDQRRFASFASRDDAVAAAGPMACDVLRAHGEVLGSTLSEGVKGSESVAMDGACDHIVRRVVAGGQLTVRASSSGLAGDAAIFCPYRRLLRPSRTAELLKADAEACRRSFESREIHIISDVVTLTHESSWMCYAAGIDNRSATIPFIPTGESEDSVFGAMLAYVYPSTLFAHLPHGVVHDSPRPSAYAAGEIRSAECLRMSDLFHSVVRLNMASMVSEAPDVRLVTAAARLDEIASLDVAELVAWLREATCDARARELARADALSQYAPSVWKDRLDMYRRRYAENVSAPEFLWPLECRDEPTMEAGMRMAQKTLREYSALLRAWRRLWSGCRDAVLT